MKLPFPALFAALAAMWVALADTFSLGDALLAVIVAAIAVLALKRLQQPSAVPRRPWTAVKLVAAVLADVTRSNVAVAILVLRPSMRARATGFVEIPLDVRHPFALAALACIITATPGTAWAGYDSQSGTLTMHVLDLVDEATLVRAVKERYERPLMEIFE